MLNILLRYKEKEMKMEETKQRCCRDNSCCLSANEIDSVECSQRGDKGECCGDESRCAEKDCIERGPSPERKKAT